MKRIRDNIWQVSYTELGKPDIKGFYKAQGLGEVLMDEADLNYIQEYLKQGFEPSFFVSQSPALNNAFVVVGRQRA